MEIFVLISLFVAINAPEKTRGHFAVSFTSEEWRHLSADAAHFMLVFPLGKYCR